MLMCTIGFLSAKPPMESTLKKFELEMKDMQTQIQQKSETLYKSLRSITKPNFEMVEYEEGFMDGLTMSLNFLEERPHIWNKATEYLCEANKIDFYEDPFLRMLDPEFIVGEDSQVQKKLVMFLGGMIFASREEQKTFLAQLVNTVAGGFMELIGSHDLYEIRLKNALGIIMDFIDNANLKIWLMIGNLNRNREINVKRIVTFNKKPRTFYQNVMEHLSDLFINSTDPRNSPFLTMGSFNYLKSRIATDYPSKCLKPLHQLFYDYQVLFIAFSEVKPDDHEIRSKFAQLGVNLTLLQTVANFTASFFEIAGSDKSVYMIDLISATASAILTEEKENMYKIIKTTTLKPKETFLIEILLNNLETRQNFNFQKVQESNLTVIHTMGSFQAEIIGLLLQSKFKIRSSGALE